MQTMPPAVPTATDTADDGERTTDRNKRLIRRYIEEIFNAGNIALLDDLVADDHINHGPLGNHCGLESIRRNVAGYRTAFPDLRLEIVDLVAEGDRIARRFVLSGTHTGDFRGIAPTGRRVTIGGMAINRIEDGKVAETWIDLDLYGLLRQLGALTDEALSSR